MQFNFLPLRFEFTACDSINFPPGKASNILRGALGIIFKRITCVPECQDADACDLRQSCAYARVFEPKAQGRGPSGLIDWPRPFIFRARHLDGCTILPGESFHFDLHIFSPDSTVLASFIQTFAALASEGLGPRRGRAELKCVRRVALGQLPEQVLYEGATGTMPASVEQASLDLAPAASAPGKIRVEFLSPTELKHENKIANRPEFPILFARIRDRISTLRALYGPGPLDIDFQAMGARAAAVRMISCQVHPRGASRQSSRTGQTHSLGGFVGVAEYEGDLAEFLPYLEAGRWVGVGRQVVWGKGEIQVALPVPGSSFHHYQKEKRLH